MTTGNPVLGELTVAKATESTTSLLRQMAERRLEPSSLAALRPALSSDWPAGAGPFRHTRFIVNPRLLSAREGHPGGFSAVCTFTYAPPVRIAETTESATVTLSCTNIPAKPAAVGGPLKSPHKTSGDRDRVYSPSMTVRRHQKNVTPSLSPIPHPLSPRERRYGGRRPAVFGSLLI